MRPMSTNPLDPLATRLVELQADRDAANQRGRELAEDIAQLLERKARLEEEIARLKATIDRGEAGAEL